MNEISVKYYNVHIASKSKNPIVEFYSFLDILRIFIKIRPDIVLNYTIKPNIYSTIVAWLTGVPSIINITGLGFIFLHESFVHDVVKKIYKVVFKIPKRIFFQNIYDLEAFKKFGILTKQNYSLLPGSGVDLNHFSYTEYPSSDEKIVFLYLGRIIEDKGIYELFHAALSITERFRNVEFVIVGKIYEKEITKRTRIILESISENNAIKLLGQKDDVRPFIVNSHAIVLPSYREGTSRALLEGGSMVYD